jgi:alcohol dehydrogenase
MVLRATDYAGACPIATVALEAASSNDRLRQATEDVFADRIERCARRLVHAGIPAKRARALAVVFIELRAGAFILSRAMRDSRPLSAAGAAAAELVPARRRPARPGNQHQPGERREGAPAMPATVDRVAAAVTRGGGMRYRPRGAMLSYLPVLAPRSRHATRIALERNAAERGRRALTAVRAGVAERLRPTRPRMRALMLWPGGSFRWHSTPAPPSPGARAAVVRPLAVATCDMDRPLGLGVTPFPLPLQFGHECVAEVLAVGEEVAAFRPGQRVVVPFQISCGLCPQCQSGHTGNCAIVPPISMYGFGIAGGHWGGAVVDELLVPYADAMLVGLPPGIEPVDAASVADNVSDGYRHVAPFLPELLSRDPDAEVLIIAGVARRPIFTPSVPLYAGLVARALGARNLYLVDTRAEVRDHAERLGLHPLPVAELRRRPPAPLVVDASGERRGLRLALSMTAPDGVCSCAGTLQAEARIPAGQMYGRNVVLRIARAHARTIIPSVLKLMTDGRLDPSLVTTLIAPFDDAPAALREHIRGGSTKTILVAHEH